MLREVALAGFTHVDLTDAWVRPGDLANHRQDELTAVAAEFGLSFSATCITRKSILDPDAA